MSITAAERIRALKEKGTITEEQAEELLGAIAENGQEIDPPNETAPGPLPAGATASEEESTGPRRGRRHSGAFFDMGWVGEMVDGITTGLGTRSSRDQGRGDEYRYEWDPRWGRQRGGNAENASRVEQPEGESFEFQENRVIFSKLAGMRLVRAKVRDNSFSASTLRGAVLTDSAIVDSSLAGASVHDLRMEGSQMRDVVIAGSKLNKPELLGGSGLKNVKIAGSTLSGFSLQGKSWIEDSRFAGVTITGCTLTEKTRFKDTRLNGTAVNRATLQGASLTDTRFDGCTLNGLALTDAQLSGCAFRGVSIQESSIIGSRIKDSRLEAGAFAFLKIENSELKDVIIRDGFEGRLPRKVERLNLIDVKLDGVQFIGCTFRDTTIKGVTAQGLKIRGKDFSGRTIESAEELRALSDR